MHHTSTFLLLRYGIVISLILAISQLTQAQSDQVYRITIELDRPASGVQVHKAPLKYNKRLAYSFTLDDGLGSHYTAAFPLLNGGYIEENNTTYPGLFYTDGCGNDVKFKAGLAWYTINSRGVDLHDNVPGFVTWSQLQEMLNAGWDVFNHSYSHAANRDDIDFNEEINLNTSAIRARTGFTTTHFVIPSGDSRYTEPAFVNGMHAVYSQGSDFPNGSGLRVDRPLDLSAYKMYRRFLADNSHDKATINRHLEEVVDKVEAGGYYWFNEFTHHVGFNQTGGSLSFDTFEYYMQYIENTYGKKGNDMIWMAPLQEVYEYLMLRETSMLSTNANGNFLEISIDIRQADAQRWKALSVWLDTDARILNVSAPGLAKVTFNREAGNGLVNLEWSGVVTSQPSRLPNKEKGMQVYPNPSAGKAMLQLKGLTPGKELTLLVLDVRGKEVYAASKKVSSENDTFEVAPVGIAKGMYIIKAISDDHTYSSPWIIE